MSVLTAFDYLAEKSEATPGLWNSPLSIISANIASIAAGPFTSPSGDTFSIYTNVETIGGGKFQYLSVGSTPPSESTTAAVTIAVNSASSDYLYLVDSSAGKSNYVIGSRVGGTADGLNLWDSSADTMIASFSKQSIRFYQNVVGPVFDVGGALADTYNAATFGTGADAVETRIQAAISQATIDGIARVYVPANMYPYSAQSVSFSTLVQMVREGGRWDVHDARAYGARSDGASASHSTSNTSAFQAMINGSVDGLPAYVPTGDYSHRGLVIRNRNITLSGERTHPFADDPRVGGSFLRHVTDNIDGVLVELTELNPYSTNYQVTLRDVGFYGPGPTSGRTGHGLFFRSALTTAGYGAYLTLERIGVRRAHQHGIFLGGAWFGAFISNVWASTCGGNGFRASRRLTFTEAAGSDQSDFVAEAYFNHLNVFNCGQFGTTEDSKCGVYFAPGGTQSPMRIARMSASACSGSGAIFARCAIDGGGWQLESNGGSGATLSALILGDTTNGYDISHAHLSGIQVDYNTSNCSAVGIELARGQNVTLAAVGFADSTASYDIWIRSAMTDARVDGVQRLTGTAALGRYLDQGYRSFVRTDGVLRVPPIVAGADATETKFTWKRTDSGNSIWGIHLDNNDWFVRDVSNGADVLRLTRSPSPQILASDNGAALRPAFAFNSERSLGLYWSASSTMRLSYGSLDLQDGAVRMPGGGDATDIRFSWQRSAGGARLWGVHNDNSDWYLHDIANAVDVLHVTRNPSPQVLAGNIGLAIRPAFGFSSERSLGWYRSDLSTMALSYGTLLVNGPVWGSGLSIGGTGTLIPAISSTSSKIAAFVVNGSSSSFTIVTWAAVKAGDQILATVQPDTAVSSLSSGLVLHSHCTQNGQIELRLSNVSTLVQLQSSKTYYFTRISPF